ncbi:MAG TPA: hypothetical protein VMI54_01850 [Polyangiaceae bacterium]|nr:hypothetical protein [Polyangiaceae bacterium]
MVELERRLANQMRGCEATPDRGLVDVESARPHPNTVPLRSQGDFLTEAHVAAPARAPASGGVVAAPASEREHVQELLDDLREHAFDRQSGLSPERREALRVLLRRERKLDSNPWSDP